MKKFVVAAMMMGLMVTGAFALTVSVSDISVPGIDAEGALDQENTGTVAGKVKVNEKNGTFSASLKGTAPNASGAKASQTVPFSETVEGFTASGDATGKYSKPSKKTPDQSKVSVKAKGMLSPVQ
ncbi:MAG: hypothetical protein R3C01_14895 [Planctomycetaceae bacterium]